MDLLLFPIFLTLFLHAQVSIGTISPRFLDSEPVKNSGSPLGMTRLLLRLKA
jgi:hypothetical protein